MNKKIQFKTLTLTLILGVLTIFSAAAKEPVYTVDQLIENPAELAGKTVTVQGECQHVCSSSGKKIFLKASTGKLVRFNAGPSVNRFDRAALKKKVTITGVVTENRTYLSDLNKTEALLIESEKKASETQEHCSTEAKANGEDVKTTPLQRIRAQKEKLAKQIAAGGKDYFATYTVNDCNEYTFE